MKSKLLVCRRCRSGRRVNAFQRGQRAFYSPNHEWAAEQNSCAIAVKLIKSVAMSAVLVLAVVEIAGCCFLII